MNTIDHPLVAAYLDAVARETAELPAERRAELLADLREHIEASRAEGEQQLRKVLTDLGEPHTVAASALAEGPPAPRRAQGGPTTTVAGPPPRRAWPTVAMLTVAGPMFLFNIVVGLFLLLASLLMLWDSPLWEQRSRVIGTVTTTAVPMLVIIAGLPHTLHVTHTARLVIVVLSLTVPAIGAAVLLRTARPTP
ncbi:HAAS signaling domain-containing protein [Streptomyces sp. NPDC004788]